MIGDALYTLTGALKVELNSGRCLILEWTRNVAHKAFDRLSIGFGGCPTPKYHSGNQERDKRREV